MDIYQSPSVCENERLNVSDRDDEFSSDRRAEMSVRFHHLRTGTEEEKVKFHKFDVDAMQTSQSSILQRLKRNTAFRCKFLQTVWVSLAFFGNGLISGQIGPSIPDLQLIVNQDLATISWLNTACAVGFATGSLIWGVVCDRFDKVLVTFLATLLEAITNGVMPWCSAFPLMAVMRALSCFFACGQVIAGTTLIMSTWKKECPPYIQAIHFAFSLGGIISPLITEPFLAAPTLEHLEDKFNLSNVNRSENISILTLNSSFGDIDYYNGTEGSIKSNLHGEETYVQLGYLVTSSLVVLCSIPLLVSFFKHKIKFSCSTNEDKFTKKEGVEKLPLRLKISILILVSIIFHCYIGIESSYVNFLMTFCLRHLKWSKADGSLASSLYWVGFCVGRFVGIFITRLFKSNTIMLTFSILISLSFIGLLFGSLYHLRPVVLIFVISVGFAFSPLFASIFSWTEERLFPVSGRITSLFLLSSSTGMATVPIYLSYLMEYYNALSFVLVMIGLSTFYLFVIIVTLIFARALVPLRQISNELNGNDDTMQNTVRETGSLYKMDESIVK